MNGSIRDDKTRRWLIFRQLALFYGKQVSPAFLKKPGELVPGVERIHPLIEGIYKPAWTNYALSIVSMLTSPYADVLNHTDSGSWWMHYSPKAGGMGVAQNVALLNCIQGHEPIIVVKQLAGKSSRRGARYRLLGLGLIERYDTSSDLFVIHGVDLQTLESVCAGLPDEETLATALRTRVVLPFAMFEPPDRGVHTISTQKRDAAFSKVVLDEYSYTCAVTGQKYRSKRHVEAQAAHIVPKKEHGSDDPRNGLALSHTLHWAFDVGLFTVSDQYEVVVHPKAPEANGKAFPLLQMDRQQLHLPDDEEFWPHQDALAWHRNEVFDRFDL